MQKWLIGLIVLFPILSAHSQDDVYRTGRYRFLSYGKILTWNGIAVNWQTNAPEIHLYDSQKYKGHGDFVSYGLKKGIRFKQFKDEVRPHNARKYLPFYLFDLREHPVLVEGVAYHWALQIQDYGYDDTREQMAETTLRLLNLVSNHINDSAGSQKKGLVILARSEEVKPNQSIATLLRTRGFPSKTISELIGIVGGEKVQVLNAGKAVGYLRYITPASSDQQVLSYRDIVIYERLPARVPPVAGIISLEPQTPLSHVNLLAKNRGTINIYSNDLRNIPGAKDALGKLVLIECTDNKIHLSEIAEREALVHWKRYAISGITICTPEDRGEGIVEFSTGSSDQVAVANIGAKASNYALIEKRLPRHVRNGYAIPFSWYLRHVKKAGADQLIAGLRQKRTPGDRLAAIEEIQKAIQATPLDPRLIDLTKELADIRFQGRKIRLRSSTNCEDLPDFNGAGLYESKGFKSADGKAKLEKKILEVYASLWSATAFQERELFGMDHAKVAMAILINEAFTDEYANGVALTIGGSGRRSIIVNSQPGELSVTNPPQGAVPESLIFDDSTVFSYRVESKAKPKAVFIGNPMMEPLLRDLVAATRKAEQLLLERAPKGSNRRYGVDIEFKITGNEERLELVLKQARLLGTPIPN
jgi:hypothetical protein